MDIQAEWDDKSHTILVAMKISRKVSK